MGGAEQASLLRLPLELHQCTSAPPTPTPASLTPLAGGEAKWCDGGSAPTSSITPPQPIPRSACQWRGFGEASGGGEGDFTRGPTPK